MCKIMELATHAIQRHPHTLLHTHYTNIHQHLRTQTHILKINFIRFERANVQNLCITLICWIAPHPHEHTHTHSHNQISLSVCVNGRVNGPLRLSSFWLNVNGGMGACECECEWTERTMVKGGFRVINLISDKVYKHRSPIKSIGVMKRRKLEVLIFVFFFVCRPIGLSWH